MAKSLEPMCPMVNTLKLIGGKWKLLILWYLSEETLRYSQLLKQVEGITSKMLTQQLRELENDGLITRHVFPVVPPKVEYTLTTKGSSLLPIMNSLHDWGKKHHHSLK